MIVDIQTRRLRTIGHRPLAVDLRAFVEGNEAVDFQPRDRDETYGFVRDTLERFGYRASASATRAWCFGSWPPRRASRSSRRSVWSGSGGRPGRSGIGAAAVAAARSRASTRRRTSGCWRKSTRPSVRCPGWPRAWSCERQYEVFGEVGSSASRRSRTGTSTTCAAPPRTARSAPCGRGRGREPISRRALDISEAAYGKQHPILSPLLNKLAFLLHDANRNEEAETLLRRALEVDEVSFGNEHSNMAIVLNNLAIFLHRTNRIEEAELLLRRALAINESAFGPNTGPWHLF